jgi:hypothetical protein
VPVAVIGGSPILPSPIYNRRHSYHPKYGRLPERDRMELDSPSDRALPDPAESFSRSWSTSSDAAPATIIDPETFNQNFRLPLRSEPRRRRRHHH